MTVELWPFLLWVACLLVSSFVNFMFVGYADMVNMFPEGRSWWDKPVQFISQVLLVLCGVFHPF